MDMSVDSSGISLVAVGENGKMEPATSFDPGPMSCPAGDEG